MGYYCHECKTYRMGYPAERNRTDDGRVYDTACRGCGSDNISEDVIECESGLPGCKGFHERKEDCCEPCAALPCDHCGDAALSMDGNEVYCNSCGMSSQIADYEGVK